MWITIHEFSNWTYPIQIKDTTLCLEPHVTRLNYLEQQSRMLIEWFPWNMKYKRLVVHYKKYNCTSVGSKYDSDPKLLQWMYNQR